MVDHEALSAPANFTGKEFARLEKKWSDIYTKFREELKELIEEAGGPEMLQVGIINGENIDMEKLVARFG